MSRTSVRFVVGVAVACVGLILGITLRPVAGESAGLVRLCIVCGEVGVPNILLNVALYAPLGFALRLIAGSWIGAVLPAAALSLAVEVSQLWLPGRHTAVIDLAANSVGAALGAVLAVHRESWIRPRAPVARTLAVSWAGLVTGSFVLFAFVMRPSVPEGPLFAQWTPRLGTLEAYSGSILQARVGTHKVQNGALEDSEALRDSLLDAATIVTRFVAGDPSGSLAPVLRLVDGEGNEAFQLGVEGGDLVVRFRYRADDWKLARPDLRVRGVLSHVSRGDTVSVRVERGAGGPYEVSVTGRGQAMLGVPSARGWSLLRYPSAWPEAGLATLDAVWLLMLFTPLGYWSTSRGRAMVLASPALVLILSIPSVTGALDGQLIHAAIGVVGVAVGWVFRNRAATPCGVRAT